MFSEETLWQFFSQYAYDPYTVYASVVLIMTASSFGLPIPEEVTLVSCGLIAYMAQNPDIYPPPTPGAVGVNLYTLAIVCFLSVLLSDILIYFLGRFFGKKIIKTKFFLRVVGEERLVGVNKWFKKYGHWACGLFRFTPGIRFPGHMSCGMLDVPLHKFLLIDGSAALISVPTQVLLVAFYGEVILDKMKEFKLIFFGVIVFAVIAAFTIRHFKKKKAQAQTA